ncbi:hypothetical protein D3C71_2000920 [compost metagenome]
MAPELVDVITPDADDVAPVDQAEVGRVDAGRIDAQFARLQAMTQRPDRAGDERDGEGGHEQRDWVIGGAPVAIGDGGDKQRHERRADG